MCKLPQHTSTPAVSWYLAWGYHEVTAVVTVYNPANERLTCVLTQKDNFFHIIIYGKGFASFDFGVWLSLLGQLVSCEHCGYYFALPIHISCLKVTFF